MTNYPKSCTHQEAIDCVRAGGEAQAADPVEAPQFTGKLFIDAKNTMRDSTWNMPAHPNWL
jgi:hypothetical protein